jgi:hypothetical protein
MLTPEANHTEATIQTLHHMPNVAHAFEKVDAIEIWLRHLERDNLYTPEIGSKVIEVASHFSLLVAERFVENSREVFEDPRFDFDQYSKLFVQAHQRFGRLTGGYFSKSYGPMLQADVDPEYFYNLTNQAVEARGKKFAGWFAYGVPDLVEAGGNPRELLSLASGLHIKGGLVMARPFILESPGLLRDHNFSLGELYELASESFDELGSKATGLATLNMYYAARLGYPPAGLVADAIEIQRKTGREGGSAAGWYMSAFRGLVKNAEGLDILCKTMGHPPKSSAHITKLEATRAKYHPLDFREQYPRVLDATGQNGATFYSNTVRLGAERDWGAWGVVGLVELADRIIEFRSKVKPQIFHSAMWFIPKIAESAATAMEFLDEVEEKSRHFSPKALTKALAYTRGVVRRGRHPGELWLAPPTIEAWEMQEEYPIERLDYLIEKEAEIRRNNLNFISDQPIFWEEPD